MDIYALKYIAMLLLAFSVQAFEIQRYSNLDNPTELGYMFRWIQDGKMQCWGMPEWVKLEQIPLDWMKVTDAAVVYRWETMPPVQGAECTTGKLYRTVGGPHWSPGPIWQSPLSIVQIGTLPSGVLCGEQVGGNVVLRTVMYNGKRGFGACQLQ